MPKMGAVEFQGVGWLGQIWVYDIAKREKGGGSGWNTKMVG